MPGNDAQRTQIKQLLQSRYFSMIPPVQANQPPAWHEHNRLTRSLAAFAIENLADIAVTQAAGAVIDGGDDNGIDALWFDRPKNILWLVQTKLGGAPNQAENKQFCGGIDDLFHGRFDRFNHAFGRLQPDVEEALETEGLRAIACDVFLDGSLGPHAVGDLNLLKANLNQFSDRFEWREVGCEGVFAWLTASHQVRTVNATLTLRRWFGLEGPPKAFYGLVSGQDLAELYIREGKALFEKNIRYYMGDGLVNQAIANTVTENPGELFYLNNGLTAICASAVPKPGASHEEGSFDLKRLSIVNGAQTVGSLAAVHGQYGQVPVGASLLLTLIEVPDDESLGTKITRARNTQNAVRGLHFAALDPQQERLRQEMAVSGFCYHYRPSADARNVEPTDITIESAVAALASFSGSIDIAVMAKREIGQLYNGSGPYYRTLFPESLTGIQLVRYARIHEFLDEILRDSEKAEVTFKRRMFYRHSRYFVLMFLGRRHRALLVKPELVLSATDSEALSRHTTDLAETIYTVAEARFQGNPGYLSIFRNLGHARPLANDVVAALNASDAALRAAQAAHGTAEGGATL